MKSSYLGLTVLASVVTLAGAQPAKDHKPAQPATPATPATPAKPATPAQPAKPADKPAMPEMPGMTPEQAAEMQAWMDAATPGAEHEHLAKGCGVWEGVVTARMMPDAPPATSHCTTTITPFMDGRYLRSETKGEFDFGMGAPMPFEGFGIYGFNKCTKQYESVWCDNMGTMIMILTGSCSADGKVMTWNTKFKDPTGKDSWMREVETRTGPDSFTLDMYGPTPDGKGEWKMMSIAYTRKDSGHHQTTPAAPAGKAHGS